MIQSHNNFYIWIKTKTNSSPSIWNVTKITYSQIWKLTIFCKQYLFYILKILIGHSVPKHFCPQIWRSGISKLVSYILTPTSLHIPANAIHTLESCVYNTLLVLKVHSHILIRKTIGSMFKYNKKIFKIIFFWVKFYNIINLWCQWYF